MEIANFAGLSHAGAPVITRGSPSAPATATNSVSSIVTPTNVSGRLNAQARRRRPTGPGRRNLATGWTSSIARTIAPAP
jgi:hypothetical protein